MKDPQLPDKEKLIKVVTTRMPFGKYKDHLICDLPEPYLVWFRKKGFPKGNIGELMELTYEVKLNGLDELLWKLKKMFG